MVINLNELKDNLKNLSKEQLESLFADIQKELFIKWRERTYKKKEAINDDKATGNKHNKLSIGRS